MVRREEPVRVAAIFEPGKALRPVWFERNRRQHRVVETTYSWSVLIGDTRCVHFAVSDGEALFELVYNLKEGTWKLRAQEPAP